MLPSVAAPRRHPTDEPPSAIGLRVVLAEDDPSVVQAVAAELARAFPAAVVEHAESRDAFERALVGLSPDVVLVDDALAWLDVREALSLLQDAMPAAPLVVIARELREEAVVVGVRAGAEDVVSLRKLDRLRRAVDRALSVRRPLRKLSPRQLHVLRLIAAGHTTPGIASRLERSPKTIETHRSEIMKRLDIHDVVGLVRYAVRVGLVTPDT
ncbi:MAG: response regulator transcription factor [Gemmatimonadales bacterium]